MDSTLPNEDCDLGIVQQRNSPTDSSPSTPDATEAVQKLQRPSSRRKGGKRSLRACATCRARKVRCNVTASGIPCSNCKFDDVQCSLPAARRRKLELGSSETGITANSHEIGKSCSYHGAAKSKTRVQDQHECSENCSVQSHSVLGVRNRAVEHLSEPCQHYTSSRTISWVQSPLASVMSTMNPSLVSHSGSHLSRIFTPFPSHIDAGNLSYLHSQDALTLPSEDLQVELLKAYIEFVHGTLPVLDLEEFLTIVKYGNIGYEQRGDDDEACEKSAKTQISFLLFQAVLFAGVGYVSTRVLKEAGYQSRESATRIFFNRVKTLYDFDVCDDRLSTVQSLLLMTLCPRTSHRETKDAWHWLGLAISLCFVLGLNRSLPFSDKRLRQKHLERRIWWIVFVRDRTLSLRSSFGSMRPVRIKKEDSQITMLGLEDFDLDQNTDRYEGLDELRTRIIAVECVEKVMICWCSDEKLVSSFSANYISATTYKNLPSTHRTGRGVPQRELPQEKSPVEPFQPRKVPKLPSVKDDKSVHSYQNHYGAPAANEKNITGDLNINSPTRYLLDLCYANNSAHDDYLECLQDQDAADFLQAVDYDVDTGIDLLDALDFDFTTTFEETSGSSVAE